MTYEAAVAAQEAYPDVPETWVRANQPERRRCKDCGAVWLDGEYHRCTKGYTP